MGIKVGDTIIGRETYSNGLWSEAKLTLLFSGKEEAVWRVMQRKSDAPRWRSAGEESCWTLDCREWWLVMHNAPHEGPARSSCADPLDAVVGGLHDDADFVAE